MLYSFLIVALALAQLAADEAPRWQFQEKFEGGKPNQYWPEGEYKAPRNRQASGEAKFAPYYKADEKFVETGDKGLTLRCLIRKSELANEVTPFQFWRWGFDVWGGNFAEANIDIEFQIRFDENFEFADEHRLLELFYDMPLIPLAQVGHEYDGPKLIFSVRGDGEARLHYFVRDEHLKSGEKIDCEKLGKLPAKLKRGVWHTVRLEGRLGDPKTDKGSIKLFLDGKEASELKIDKTVLRRNDRAWTSVVWGGPVRYAKNVKVDCSAELRGLSISSPK